MSSKLENASSSGGNESGRLSAKPKIALIPGDLFDAPENSVLIHACNCVGNWGSGVAKAFKDNYPAAYQIYRAHCLSTVPPPPSNPSHKPTSASPLLGTTLLIPPQCTDYEPAKHGNDHRKRRKHYIACLFTSTSYGAHVDSPASVLKNTKLALVDLQRQASSLEQMSSNELSGEAKEVGKPKATWHSAKINSKRFKVEWERTERCFLEALEGSRREVIVYEYEEGNQTTLPGRSQGGFRRK